jgi:hypothetical protein
MSVVKQTVEHGADRCRVAEQFAPVFYRTVRSQHSAGPLVAAHDDLQQFFSGRNSMCSFLDSHVQRGSAGFIDRRGALSGAQQ